MASRPFIRTYKQELLLKVQSHLEAGESEQRHAKSQGVWDKKRGSPSPRRVMSYRVKVIV
jgi:hypothetical protein